MGDAQTEDVKATNGITNGHNNVEAESQTLDIAIVGGGIVGLILSLGLLKRGMHVKIYEQSQSFHEIGAGVAFTANAQRCMHLLDPRILESMQRIGDKNPNDYYQYVDGYHHNSAAPTDTHEELLFKIHAGKVGFDGCHRAYFLDELVKLLPEGTVEFRKRFNTYFDRGDDQKLLLNFEDGSSAEADLVIGCDGIKSRTRQIILGKKNPASYPRYTHKVAFRGLVPMDEAVAALGQDKAFNQCMHMGPKAHVLNFPVAMKTMMNVVAFVDDHDNWSVESGMTAPASRAEVSEVFSDWGPAVRAIVNLLPQELTKWAIFDMYDHPAPSYSQGRACLAGDAAHAASPHHGAGAGFGVEDALAMSTVMEEVTAALQSTAISKPVVVRAALHAYSMARHERTQWLVQSSRQVCEVYEWANPQTGIDPEKCKREIEWRAHKIWYFDIDGMLQDVKEKFRRLLHGDSTND